MLEFDGTVPMTISSQGSATLRFEKFTLWNTASNKWRYTLHRTATPSESFDHMVDCYMAAAKAAQ